VEGAHEPEAAVGEFDFEAALNKFKKLEVAGPDGASGV
jgi:hypothetical protein